MPRYKDPVPELKRRVADEILVLMEGWSQTWAAAFMGVSQSRVSDLRRGNLDRISLERLVQCLSNLGREVRIETRRALGPSVHRHDKVDRASPRSSPGMRRGGEAG